ncbi:hypothetical protein FOL46_002638, partial [Perkinsus olseni]
MSLYLILAGLALYATGVSGHDRCGVVCEATAGCDVSYCKSSGLCHGLYHKSETTCFYGVDSDCDDTYLTPVSCHYGPASNCFDACNSIEDCLSSESGSYCKTWADPPVCFGIKVKSDGSICYGGEAETCDGEPYVCSDEGVAEGDSIDGITELPDEEDTTEAPAMQTTMMPVETTGAASETTETPVETTEAPVETTEAPVETTEAPAETTEAPAETTEAPAETTEAPAETTEAPAETTEAPAETTEAPAETTEAPAEANDIPVEVSQGCMEICNQYGPCRDSASGSYCKTWLAPSVCFGITAVEGGYCYSSGDDCD